ncbi:MAG: mandelate racemase/muconate lactonizing protein [Actinobacteria bacterium]|nr:mandelate racemase/muconate lactonizing protein [Actinomycetota bacterium]
MRIEAIEVLEVRVPRTPRNRIITSYAALPDAHNAIVRVRAEGLEGVGEAPTERWWTGEDAASVRHAIEQYLAPELIGRDVGLRAALQRMEANLAANPYAKAAIEMALWDLLGKAAGQPLYALLGGGPPRPVPIKYVIGRVEPSRARDETQFAQSLGFTYVKVKVGGALADDLARVAAVRDVLRPGQRVGVDANAGWSPVEALAALAPLASAGISFLEQPVAARYPGVMAELTRRSAVPVVAHESLFTVRDAYQAAVERVAHIWAVTPSTHGGILPALDILSVARAAGLPCLIGSTVELGIATAAMAHLGAAVDLIADCPVPSDVIGPLYHEGDIVVAQPRLAGGFAYAPDGPGLGVELDHDAVQKFAVKA